MVRFDRVEVSGRLQTAFGTGFPTPGHSKIIDVPGLAENAFCTFDRNVGGLRGVKSTANVVRCGKRKSKLVIEFMAEQEYVPESRCVTDDNISAPDGSCGNDEGTATVSLHLNVKVLI